MRTVITFMLILSLFVLTSCANLDDNYLPLILLADEIPEGYEFQGFETISIESRTSTDPDSKYLEFIKSQDSIYMEYLKSQGMQDFFDVQSASGIEYLHFAYYFNSESNQRIQIATYESESKKASEEGYLVVTYSESDGMFYLKGKYLVKVFSTDSNPSVLEKLDSDIFARIKPDRYHVSYLAADGSRQVIRTSE